MNDQYDKNCICNISDVGVVDVTGEDAESFLQAQLTSDIKALDAQHWQRSAYCNPKGRVIAILEIVRKNDGFSVITHADLLAPLVKRLSIYVLRAKVQFNALEGVQSIGVSGRNVGTLLQEQWPELASDNLAALWHDEVLIRCIGSASPRLMFTGPADKISALQQQLGVDHVDVSGDEWERFNIIDGIPSVCSTTSEQFIPQALNLDLIDGVSFNKGCYPGQEIVARVHFLGKTKQRMRLAHVSADTSLAPGDPVYREGQEQRAGTIVDAVCNKAGCDALISINSNDNEKFYADSSPDALVEWLDLPYAVVT